MIFHQIDFHNVEQMEKTPDGWKMWRLPESLREQLNPGLRENTAAYSTGVELRFKLKSRSADVILKAPPHAEAQMACLYYGSIQGGWSNSTYVIGTAPTRIHVEKPDNLERLRDITREAALPFSPEVFRLVLPYGTCLFVDAEGELEPPAPEDVPSACYLAYGSSITHGSLGLTMPYSYPFRIAQRMKCDYLNLGFAGTAHMERAMAEYIVSRKDWTFASVEMGINTLGENWTDQRFEETIDAFTAVLAADPRPVFATSLFGFNTENAQSERFRAIVRAVAGSRLPFIDGLDILNNPDYISQDLVHPTTEGMEQIVDRFGAFIAANLPTGALRR